MAHFNLRGLAYLTLTFQHQNVSYAIQYPQVSFLDQEGGSQKATLVVLVVVISSLKIPTAFLICSGGQKLRTHLS